MFLLLMHALLINSVVNQNTAHFDNIKTLGKPMLPFNHTKTIDNIQPHFNSKNIQNVKNEIPNRSSINMFICVLLIINYIPIIFLGAWYFWDKYINTGAKLVLLDRVSIKFWLYFAQSPLAISIWSQKYLKKRRKIKKATGKRDEWDIEEKDEENNKGPNLNKERRYKRSGSQDTDSIKQFSTKTLESTNNLQPKLESTNNEFDPKVELGNILKSFKANTLNQDIEHSIETRDGMNESKSDLGDTKTELPNVDRDAVNLEKIDLTESQNFDSAKKVNPIPKDYIPSEKIGPRAKEQKK